MTLFPSPWFPLFASSFPAHKLCVRKRTAITYLLLTLALELWMAARPH